jgi:hypothetical protein
MFPVTLYGEQWDEVLDENFIATMREVLANSVFRAKAAALKAQRYRGKGVLLES